MDPSSFSSKYMNTHTNTRKRGGGFEKIQSTPLQNKHLHGLEMEQKPNGVSELKPQACWVPGPKEAHQDGRLQLPQTETDAVWVRGALE